MDESFELIRDYNECNRRITEFNSNNYYESGNWAMQKYLNWISKNEEYALAPQLLMQSIPPKDELEKALNRLNNLKTVLLNIAVKNGIELK